MHDEIPAPSTSESNPAREPNPARESNPTGEPNPARESNPTGEPTSSRSDRREADGDDRDELDRDGDRPRDGVDPPEETEGDRSERSRSKPDEDGEPETAEYRLERLRLVRIVVTLAVVVARLIRSF